MRKLAPLLMLLALAGCGSNSKPTPSNSKSGSSAAIPPALIGVPPESARTPEGAKPARPPVSLPRATLGEKHIDGTGLLLIERFEGYSRCAYWDPYGRVWTAGFGQTRGVYGGFCFASQTAAQNNLRASVIAEYEWAVRAVVGNSAGQNVFDALDSFAYNLGAGIFTGSLRSNLQAHNYRAAGQIMLQYDHAGGQVLPGLRTRRELEVRVLLSAPAPRPSLSALYARRRALRRVLLRDGCRARVKQGQKLGPKCSRWLREDPAINAQIKSRGGH